MVRERERNREWRGPANEDGEEWKEQSGRKGKEGEGGERQGTHEEERKSTQYYCMRERTEKGEAMLVEFLP